jgi:hypothetical protein
MDVLRFSRNLRGPVPRERPVERPDGWTTGRRDRERTLVHHPGKKLYEDLYFDDEEMFETAHPKLRTALSWMHELDDVRSQISGLAAMLDEQNEVLRAKLQERVLEYQPSISFVALEWAVSALVSEHAL